MTDVECAEILADFRKLTLGPELSAALDHAIGRMQPTPMPLVVWPNYRVPDAADGLAA